MIDEIASSNAQVAPVFITYFTKVRIVNTVDELEEEVNWLWQVDRLVHSDFTFFNVGRGDIAVSI